MREFFIWDNAFREYGVDGAPTIPYNVATDLELIPEDEDVLLRATARAFHAWQELWLATHDLGKVLRSIRRRYADKAKFVKEYASEMRVYFHNTAHLDWLRQDYETLSRKATKEEANK